MNFQRKITKLNEHIGAELGRNPLGGPRYKWIWSEAPELLHPMHIEGEYDYKANPATGLIESEPLYKLRKMCLSANRQWVLCHWIESPSPEEWRRHFGRHLEWPRHGQYYPTNVSLDPGVVPDETINQVAIETIRECFKKSPAEVEREATEALEKREAKKQQDQYEEIRSACTTYDHVPGTRDAVSYPSPQPVTP